MTQRGASLLGRVTTITRHYSSGVGTKRPTWTAAAVATNGVFSALNWMNGRKFELLSPTDTMVWSTTPLQLLRDKNGRIPVENVRNASQEQIQQRIDAIANSATRGSRYRAVRPIEDADPHEYLVESTIPISTGGMTSLKQELQSRPDNVHRLMMAAIAMRAVPLDGERANRIVAIQQDAIASLRLPTNQLTDTDVQRSKENFAHGSKLEANMQLGQFNIITTENPRTWSQGDRFYFSYTARTTQNIHIFADGVAQHTGCLDTSTGFLHFSVVGAGTSQTCLAALANVTSAASMWSNRGEAVAKICDTANGQALNTFDLQELITQATNDMDTSRQLERWALRTLDTLSGAVVMVTDAWLNSSFVLPDAARPATMDAIKISYANQEPYLPDDMLTPLKEETDILVRETLARPVAIQENPNRTDVVGNGEAVQQDHTNDTPPVQDDPFAAAQDALSPDDRTAIAGQGQEESGSGTPANDGLADPGMHASNLGTVSANKTNEDRPAEEPEK